MKFGALRRRSTKVMALVTVGVLLVLGAVIPGRALFGIRTSVARAYSAYQTALGSVSGDGIMTTITELSSPACEGRQAGAPGGRRAGEYIAAQFRDIGLQPMFDGSYFQEFRIAYSHPAGAPSMRLYDPQGREVSQPKYGRDIAYSLWSDSADVRKAPVVFVGSWDGVADVDLKGKVALTLRPGATVKSLYSSLERARAAGALAMITIVDERTVTAYWDVDTIVPGIAMAGITAKAADTLLQSTGKDALAWSSELAATAKAGSAFTPIDTGMKVDLAWSIDNDNDRTARNVVGVIPGAAGIAASRSILLTAHYDHLGTLPGGPVWQGAWDNASGVAVMLAAARALAQVQPDVNIVVAAWDAEERGLVGSAWFARNLPLPAGSLIGVVNLDCVGAKSDFRLERSPVGTLSRRIASAAARYKIGMDGAPVRPWSDAASFDGMPGVQAIQIFDAGDPYAVPFLHDPSDTVANLKADALERIARTVALGIIAESEAQSAK